MPIGASMLIASAVIAIMAKMPLSTVRGTLLAAIKDDMTIKLVLIVFLIGILGSLLKETGSLDIMLNKLGGLIKDIRILIVLLPSLIGLLTVPGGAVLSAPMVEKAGDKINISREKLCAANIVFRHLWYFVFPLYPTLILVTEMGDIEMHQFLLFNLPIVIIVFLVSFYYLFYGVTDYKQKSDSSSSSRIRDFTSFIRSISPILVAVFMAMFFDIYLPIALLLGTILAFINYLETKEGQQYIMEQIRNRFKYVKAGMNFNMVLAIIGIMVFKDFVEASGAINLIANWMVSLGVSLEILILAATFVTGFLTANHIAGVGIIYPVLSPLFPAAEYVPLMGLLFAGGVTGYLISPMHLCLILTREYFEVAFFRMYLHVVPLILMMLLGAGLTAFFWQLF